MDFLKDNKKIRNILFIFSILLCLILMQYWIMNKEGFHEDEIFSYGSSNYEFDNLFQAAADRDATSRTLYQYVYSNNPIETLRNAKYYLIDHKNIFDENVSNLMSTDKPIWKTPEDARKYLTVSSDEIFNYGSVYINQVRDVHPPLFYFLVHLVSSIFLNTFSKYIIFIINAVFFVAGCIVLRKILKLYNKDYLSIPLILLYGLSTGAVSTVIFLRMYSMVTFFCILYLYINLKIARNNYIIDKKLKTSLILTTILGFLTQYYFCVYAVFIFIIMLINMLCHKNYKKAFKYTLYHIFSAIIGILIFPRSIFHIFLSYRGVGSVNTTQNIFMQTKDFFDMIFNSYSLGAILGTILLACGVVYILAKFVISLKNKTFDLNRFCTILIFILPAILYTFVVAKISPFTMPRYIMPVLPIFALCFIIFLDSIFNNFIKINIRAKYLTKVSLIYIIVGLITIPGLYISKPICLYTGYNDVLKIAEENKNMHYIYVTDNGFTHINSLPEFMIYEKSMILNTNNDDFSILSSNEELQNQNQFILTIKTWLNVDETLNKVLESSHFTKADLLLNGGNEAESAIYLIKK